MKMTWSAFKHFRNRVLLWALFFIFCMVDLSSAACSDIYVFKAEEMLKNKEVVLLDVREPYEFSDCRIPGSINIPGSKLPQRYNRLNKDAAIVVYCRTSRRSLDVCRFLDEKGFKRVFNMAGGIAAWYNTGRKLEGSCDGIPYFAYDEKGKVIRPKMGEAPPEPEIKGCK